MINSNRTADHTNNVPVTARVLNIVKDGIHKQDPCVLLVDNEVERPFEAWLAYSTRAVEAARKIQVGDQICMDGYWSKPVRSHRDHSGLHQMYKEIEFFRVTELRKIN